MAHKQAPSSCSPLSFGGLHVQGGAPGALGGQLEWQAVSGPHWLPALFRIWALCASLSLALGPDH